MPPELANAPPTVRSTCGTFWPKNGSQPHISPRLRCFNRKITQKLCATCITRHLFWLVISPSCCSRQGPPLWNCGNFDHFNPLPTTLNVIWLQKVVPNLPFTYLGKVKKNWQLFPLIFFGESQKYQRGGVCRPPPASNRVKYEMAFLAPMVHVPSATKTSPVCFYYYSSIKTGVKCWHKIGWPLYLSATQNLHCNTKVGPVARSER